MFPEKDALPGTEVAPTVFDGDGQRREGQDRSDMGRHIVGAFAVVNERGIAVGHETGREHARDRGAPWGRRFRRRSTMRSCDARTMTQSPRDAGPFDGLLDLPSDLDGSAAARLDRQILPVHGSQLRSK